MRISKWLFGLLLVLLCAIGITAITGNNQKDSPSVKGKEVLKEEPIQNNFPDVPKAKTETSVCIEECIRGNQMASVGFSMIEEQCHSECGFEDTLALLKSSQDEDYERGVKVLSEINDPRTVQPLILALKRDLEERRGLWAWIIPALGASGDPAAVPVLTHTLTINDDFWLGRDMSAQALGDIGGPSVTEPLLAAAWRAETRDTAIKALVNFHDKRAVPVFLSALDPEEEKQTRVAAINGLRLLGEAAIPQIVEVFINHSPEYPETEKRLSLCKLLGTSKDNIAIKTLQESMTDPDKYIRECAAGFLKSKE